MIGVGCDVSSELSVQKAFEMVMDNFGRVDSVVASAGELDTFLCVSLCSEELTASVGRYRGELFCIRVSGRWWSYHE